MDSPLLRLVLLFLLFLRGFVVVCLPDVAVVPRKVGRADNDPRQGDVHPGDVCRLVGFSPIVIATAVIGVRSGEVSNRQARPDPFALRSSKIATEPRPVYAHLLYVLHRLRKVNILQMKLEVE